MSLATQRGCREKFKSHASQRKERKRQRWQNRRIAIISANSEMCTCIFAPLGRATFLLSSIMFSASLAMHLAWSAHGSGKPETAMYMSPTVSTLWSNKQEIKKYTMNCFVGSGHFQWLAHGALLRPQQRRIQKFPGAPTCYLQENCMKMKKNRPGGTHPNFYYVDPPMPMHRRFS